MRIIKENRGGEVGKRKDAVGFQTDSVERENIGMIQFAHVRGVTQQLEQIVFLEPLVH